MDCKVCFELFNEDTRKPININCGHTFCSKCLDTLTRMNKRECPMCKTRITSKLSNFALIDVLQSDQHTDSKLVAEIEKNLKQMESLTQDIQIKCYQQLQQLNQHVNSIKSKINEQSLKTIKLVEQQQNALNEEADAIQTVINERVERILMTPKYNVPDDYKKMKKQELEAIKTKINESAVNLNSRKEQLKEFDNFVKFNPSKQTAEIKLGSFQIEESMKACLSEKVCQRL